MVGWYDGESAQPSYNKWFDKSGLKNDALVDVVGLAVVGLLVVGFAVVGEDFIDK